MTLDLLPTFRPGGSPVVCQPPREVLAVVDAQDCLEGEGFPVRRPFPGIDMHLLDPFLVLDHMGAVTYAPGEAKGAPAHPHRGFETVSYVLEGGIEHHDSTGGGGIIGPGDVHWMTAGAGVVHSEMPARDLTMRGGRFHVFQLWVNLPRALKWTAPRYQDVRRTAIPMLGSAEDGVCLRLLAGELAGQRGPAETRTPILLAHASLRAGQRLRLPWPASFNALVYVLAGASLVGAHQQPLHEGQLAVLGEGGWLDLRGATSGDGSAAAELLLLGGEPIREPVVHYGPFVMNTPEEIQQAIDDYRAGRLAAGPAINTEAGRQVLPPVALA